MKRQIIAIMTAVFMLSVLVSVPLQADEKHQQETQKRKKIQHAKAELAESGQPGLSLPQGPDGVSVAENTAARSEVADGDGNRVLMGTCTNSGTASAVFVQVNANFYGVGDKLLGTDSRYVYGGTNAQLTSTGAFTNALYPGDTGYFKMSTDLPCMDIARTDIWFTYDTYGHSQTNAALDFLGSPLISDDHGYPSVSGQVKNSSSSYVSYFTETYFALFNARGNVIDVDSSYVIGSSYNYGSGTTDTALQPGETGSFSNTFWDSSYSDASSTLSSLAWYEKNTSPLEERDPPFGSFDTPLDGSTVRSSIPVTGWALDDSGVEHVKVYRHSGGSLVYLGDAAFIEGARPDVAAAYPDYPNNTSAGWGYMMLTNFLPGGGNGTYVIEAIATDAVGKTTSLGTRTITADNANAVKPFGAIDTPTQGGAASGSGFINWGWALTPQPNSIPTDGSTINVYVDGASIGNPTYNIYRQDIATFFPGYANSNGAVGYFYLDTTAYADGVHSIYWTAKDTGNNTDGIGSRYFSISNTERLAAPNAQSKIKQPSLPDISHLNRFREDRRSGIKVKQGFGNNDPQFQRNRATNVRQLEKVEIHLAGFDGPVNGYLVVGDTLADLPLGSTLQRESGVFHWIPGHAQFGRHHLVFTGEDAKGKPIKQHVTINVIAKYN